MVNLKKNTAVIDPNKGLLIKKTEDSEGISELLSKNTYVGIDFGTSTTVVSFVTKDREEKLNFQTLKLDQSDKYGGVTNHHLVNSVLAWYKGALLFGAGAYELRKELFEGRNIFSSFKMRLGVDIGPTYPETALKSTAGYDVVIENANDATREFFKLLHASLVKALKDARYPVNVFYAVSVPASFEANQRRDLIRDIKAAGIPIEESCLIDEPNAAFLSYIHEASRSNQESTFLKRLQRGESSNLIVFDFGAGTCDVSILEIKNENNSVASKNLAISRFTALGGDNFDREIARMVLLPQLLKSLPESADISSRHLEEYIVPMLQPAAEELKITAINWITDRGIGTLEQIKKTPDCSFTSQPVPKFKLNNTEFRLEKPTLHLHNLIDIFSKYIGTYNKLLKESHIYSPIDDALNKSGLTPNDVNAILFIGGSAMNPLIQNALKGMLPQSVEALVPRDLRSHVSVGASIHSYGYHAFGTDIIKPITSEAIYLITKNNRLEIIIPVSTEVPTIEARYIKCKISENGQRKVQLPICVGNINKLIGLLEIISDSPDGFKEDDEVTIAASISHDKILHIGARVANQELNTMMVNPLANSELNAQEKAMLKAKQAFNLALLKHGSGMPKDIVLKYASKSSEAGAYETAADMYRTVERLDPSENRATEICYNYAMAGDEKKSNEWAEIAYERNPNYLNCWNLSLVYGDDNPIKEKLLRDSISKYKYLPALYELGMLLYNKNSDEGKIYLKDYKNIAESRLNNNRINRNECKNLISICKLLNYNDLKLKAEMALSEIEPETSKSLHPGYEHEYLVKSNDKIKIER